LKKTFKNLWLFLILAAVPRLSYAQVAIQNLTVNPAILCAGAAVTVTFQAALPGNSTGSQDISLMGAFSTAVGVTNANSYVFIHDNTAYTTTFTDSLETGATFSGGSWATINPPFSNFVTYTAITTVPPYVNGTVVYLTIGANNNFYQAGSNLSMAASVQAAVTVDCTKSDAINTGNGVFVNAGVTYTGESNPVTVLISNAGCFTNTFTNTSTTTFTYTPTPTPTFTSTFTNTFTATPTRTFTNTFTQTDTYTFTNTFTNTFTPTVTNTVTPTKTNTSTFTNTDTATATNTPTASPTFTNTYTKTFTSTFTNTFTPTDTPTVTNTPTMTPTATFTQTFINTPTFTDTFTQTPTYTFTDTPTPSPTATNTFTNTPTFTYTNTFMNSPTFTNTFTNTPTLTFTNTFVNTPTFTDTFTNTPTMTYTNTFVNTPTFTNTFTQTPTYTFTNTATATFTATYTSTYTNTVTNTPTATNTNTLINTATFTNTFTATSTPTSAVSMGKSVSTNQVHSGDTLTYSIGVTVTGNKVSGIVVTDTLPANMTFAAFESYPSGASVTYNSSTSLLQWILPSPMSPGIYTLTYETQINHFAPANVPLINFAQLNYPGLGSSINSSVPVTVIGNFTIKVNIYNSAGEVVKTITTEEFSEPINNITLSTTNTISSLKGVGSTIEILYNGFVIGTWDGTNNSGLPVTNGQYKVQIDNVGASGVVTSVAQNAIVNRSLSNIEADVYNSSGEVVRKLYYVVDDPVGSNMTNVTLSSNVLRPSLNAHTSISGGTTYTAPTTVISYDTTVETIYIQTSGTPVTLVWDGTNNGGTIVTPGEYTIEVHWNNGSGQTTDISRQVLVMANTSISGAAIARPNVLGPATTLTTTFDASSVLMAAGLKIKIFTVTGELIQSFSAASTTAPWSAAGLASGIYIANIEIDNANGGVINQQRLKILVIH
jgi:flagellar hook assembly protein FlgD